MHSLINVEHLVHAFMTSRLEYCNALLGGCLINKLQLVQNKNRLLVVIRSLHSAYLCCWTSTAGRGKPANIVLRGRSNTQWPARWRQVQYVAELFWKRWTAEYSQERNEEVWSSSSLE